MFQCTLQTDSDCPPSQHACYPASHIRAERNDNRYHNFILQYTNCYYVHQSSSVSLRTLLRGTEVVGGGGGGGGGVGGGGGGGGGGGR